MDDFLNVLIKISIIRKFIIFFFKIVVLKIFLLVDFYVVFYFLKFVFSYFDYIFISDFLVILLVGLNRRYFDELLRGVILDIYFLFFCDYLVCIFLF